MSNIYFMCENCGIETNGITFVNGMKFCAKCYHQIFGKDNQQTEITQLKQQLAEKDKEIERLKFFEKAYYYNQLQASEDTIKNLFRSSYQSPIAINLNQIAIQELEKVKVNLKDRITMMSNEEHSYLQKVVIWYDICNQVNKQIKELKGDKDETQNK